MGSGDERDSYLDDLAASAEVTEETDIPPEPKRGLRILRPGDADDGPDIVMVDWTGGLMDHYDAAIWLFGERSENGNRTGGVLPLSRWSDLHGAWMVLQEDMTWASVRDVDMISRAAAWLRKVRAVKYRDGKPVLDEDGEPKIVPMRVTDGGTRGIMSMAMAHWFVRPVADAYGWPSPPGVPFSDGRILERDGVTIRPIRPSDAVTYVLPCTIESSTETPRLDAWARAAWGEALWEECLTVYLRWLGATLLWEGASMHRALYLYGLQGRGKSVLLKVTEALFPPGLVASVEPGALGNFDAEPLARAQVNICDDLTKAERWSEGVFKTAVTGGLLRIDRKHKQQINARPKAGWIMAGNIPPDLRDPAVSRRVAVLYFGGKAWASKGRSAEGIDRRLHDRIVEEEGGALVLRAVRTYLAHRDEDLLTPAAFAEHIEEAERLNPVVGFVADCLILDEHVVALKRSEVYEAYRAYCGQNGNKPLSAQNFAAALREVGIESTKRRGYPMIVGYRLEVTSPELSPGQVSLGQSYGGRPWD